MMKKGMATFTLAASLLGTIASIQHVEALNNEKVSVKMTHGLEKESILSLNITGSYYYQKPNTTELVDITGQFQLKNSDGNLVLVKAGIETNLGTEFSLKPKVYGTSSYAFINEGKVNKRKLIGDIKFSVNDGKIQTVNTLMMEDYLKSVMIKEMNGSWEIEALKAQAVAARTYAERYGSGVLQDNTNDQVYGGFDWKENTNSTKAVELTDGEYMVDASNGVLDALYYSSNGGKIEINSNVWGGTKLPYLNTKQDPFDPQTEFKYEISENDLKSKVQKFTDTNIEKINFVRVTEKTEAGYAKTITFDINNGQNFSVAGTTLRSELGTLNLKGLNLHRIAKAGNVFVFQGKGFGHGVGMSQYGAKEMAVQGRGYEDVLGFYYAGASLVKKDGTKKELIVPDDLPAYVEKDFTPIYEIVRHTVVKGNNLYNLSKAYNVSISDIQKWNGKSADDTNINLGQVLIVNKILIPYPDGENTETNKPEEKPEVEEDVTAPAEVSNLKATKTTNSIELSFEKPNDTDFSHMELYRDSKLVQSKLITETYKDLNLQDDKAYTYIIKTVDKTGNKSKGATIQVKTDKKQVTPTGQYYTIQTGDTLWGVSTKFKLTVDEIKKLNGLKTNVIYKGQKLLVSNEKVEKPTPNPVPSKPTPPTTTQKTYAVKKGDSLYKIATANKMTVHELKTLNGLKSDVIVVGQVLKVSGTITSTPSPTPNPVPDKPTPPTTTQKTYAVKKGDSLYKIATANKMTVHQLKTLNGLKSDVIVVGQVLKVSGTITSTPTPNPVPSKPTPPVTTQKTYAVKKGDSLYKIAIANKMTVHQLKTLNGLKNDVITIGQVLKVSGTVTINPKPTTPSQKTYTVKKGDTLYKIATSNKISVNELKKVNGLKNNVVYVGQKLKV